MATLADWVAGARPRTLPAAVSPVVAGTGAAVHAGGAVWWKALLALVLALALQVGVNYANDYSDGIRGTDTDRVGPLRLVGSGVAIPAAVRRTAFASFGVGALAGVALAATTAWWLLAVGALAVAAAWFYTGGSKPYGYRGFGEVSVFVFFGLVAVLGTTFVQLGSVTVLAVLAAVGTGALACAILVVNNLRDIPSDTASDKRTLAVILGDRRTRVLFGALLLVALACLVAAALIEPAAALGAVGLPPAARAVWRVQRGTVGPELVEALRDTGLAELGYAVGLAIGLALGA
ncbi:MAG: 1,4-dihydroxy-2-naphthoate polyprenyltransferase [Nocardioidaceae bacterium]